MDNWRGGIANAMKAHGENFTHIVANTMDDAEMDKGFNDNYGSTDGCTFTVWTAKRVYFPAVYDGAEWVASVSRDPDGKPTKHVGGG